LRLFLTVSEVVGVQCGLSSPFPAVFTVSGSTPPF
jgi:hypothetical protein